MKNARTVYVLRSSKKQHSTWMQFEDAVACLRILFKRGRKSLSIEIVTLS